jgi:hypothetical protein
MDEIKKELVAALVSTGPATMAAVIAVAEIIRAFVAADGTEVLKELGDARRGEILPFPC